MKNLFVYYFLISFPIPILIWLLNLKLNISFLFFLITYYLYRLVIDYYRLLSIGLINKNDFLKSLIPFWKSKYFYWQYFKI